MQSAVCFIGQILIVRGEDIMYMLLHHQKHHNFKDGSFINIGEDGCPYADNELLIVADGLGGRGGYPHAKINPDILDPNVFYTNFIGPVVGEASDAYAHTVTYSFSELFKLGNGYFTNTSTMRTSGYFASRLVTAIVLHAFKFNQVFNRNVIFSNLYRLEGEEQKKYIGLFCNELEKLISRQLTDMALRMGLELESKTKGSYLLPTTLTVALVNETAEGVDVLYIWAGDSRGYIWNSDGLAQVTDDHERDETMTNLITLTKPFKLEARLIKLSKPVILFNATDGCYKCPCFASAFDLEYIFLKAIECSQDWNNVSKNLDEQFGVIGTHDDSNTMALYAYGYESFESIKKAAEQRIGYLNEHIVNELPDILERDYEEELNRIDEQIENIIYSTKDDIIKINTIVEILQQKMVADGYEPYVKELTHLNSRLNDINKAFNEQRDNLVKWVKYYWLRTPCLKKYTVAADKWGYFDSYDKFATDERLYQTEKQSYMAAYLKILQDLQTEIAGIASLQDSIVNRSVQRNESLREQLAAHIKSVRTLLNKIEADSIKDKPEKEFSLYIRLDCKMNEWTNRYVKSDREAINQLVSQILNGNFRFDGIELPQACRSEIEECLKNLQQILADRSDVTAQNNGLKEKHLMSYWNNNVRNLMWYILREHSELVPREIRDRISGNADSLHIRRAELVYCVDVRNQLYDIYNKSYYRYFEESSL